MRLSWTLGLLGGPWTAVLAADNHQTTTSEEVAKTAEPTYAQNELHIAQDPMQMGAMIAANVPDSPRHRREKAHLMKRMSRKHGTWGPSHPRYRLLEALSGFKNYRARSMTELERWRDLYKNVGKKQKKTLERVVNYREKLEYVRSAIYANVEVCDDIVFSALKFYSIDEKELSEHIREAESSGRHRDSYSAGQALKHFIRDWAAEGAKERNDAFPCILSTISSIKDDLSRDETLKILLPGSGVGRLGHEVAKLGGFDVSLNEWSMFMNVAYRFLENGATPDSFAMYPFIDGMSHHATTSDMMRRVTAPESSLDPSVLLVEGDFNTAFSDQVGQYDIIITHFFIDTARNLMSYFDTIHFLLKPGGKWLNFGPLLYGTGPFVQLSLDEIISVVEEMGFRFEDIGEQCGILTFEDKKVRSKEAEYGFNSKALTKNAYSAQVWVATRK